MFIKESFHINIIIIIYIDDIKVIYKDIQWINTLKNDICSKFKINNIKLINYYLEIKIERNKKKTLTLL